MGVYYIVLLPAPVLHTVLVLVLKVSQVVLGNSSLVLWEKMGNTTGYYRYSQA